MHEGEKRGARAPALLALFAGAVAEGVVAAAASGRGGGDLAAGVAAFAAAASVLVVAGVVPTLLVAWLLDRPSTRTLGRRVRDGLGGDTAVALLVVLASLGLATAAGALAGQRLAAMMTARFAAAATALVTVGALAACALLAAPVGHTTSRMVKRVLDGKLRAGTRVTLALALVASAVLVLTLFALPPEWSPAPAAVLVGLTLGTSPYGRLPPRARSMHVVVVVVVIVLAAGATVASLDRLPGASRIALLYGTPWSGNALASLHALTDADGDGFSPLVLGGDCDDGDPGVFPGAPDVPDNGVDENCSGSDASEYSPIAPPRARPEVPARQNVVLVQIDALRPDHMSFAGYERPTTPRLDRFRESATWFENAYTPAPSTRFAMTALFTGADARRVPHQDLGANRFRLEPAATTVAEQLGRAGYDTVGYTISYVMHHNQGLGQGFRVWTTPWPVDDWAAAYPVAAERTTDAALEYLAGAPSDGSRPFLLFAHYRCTHDPYIGYDEWDYGDSDVDRYDSALNYCDREVGRVLDALEARADHDRTSVVIFSDHGELFGDHGLTNHGNSLYEPDVRILLLARIPGTDRELVTVPVLLSDIAPTTLELAGLDAPGDIQGWSLLAHLADEAPTDPAARPLYLFTDLWRANVHHEARAVLSWPHKYLRDLRTGAEQLFDVAADPGEEVDLAGDDRLRLELAELLDAYEAHVQ